MASVFISYASANRAEAQRLAQSLQAAGLEVWWDRKLIAGDAFDEAIERALDACSCAVVLWSDEAVNSRWVRAEASTAAQRDVMVSAWIERVRLPLEFRQRHTVDLSGWQGEADHPGYVELERAVRARLAGAGKPAASRPQMVQTRELLTASSAGAGSPPPEVASSRSGSVRWIAVALAVVGVLVAAVMLQQQVRQPGPSDAAATGSPPANLPAAATSPAPSPASTSPMTLESAMARAEGRYVGDIVSASQGPSRSDVVVTVRVVGSRELELQGDDPRIGTLRVPVSRVLETLMSEPMADGTGLLWELKDGRALLQLSPRGELSYFGLRP